MWGSVVAVLDEWGLPREYRELTVTPKAVEEKLAATAMGKKKLDSKAVATAMGWPVLC